MADQRVVMVTGAARHLGGRVARQLAVDPGVARVLGIDVLRPDGDELARAGVDFVRADIRNPILAQVIDSAGVDTVVHMSVLSTPLDAGASRTRMKEINVIGTMQLLAACQQAASVRRLVVKSSAQVYGVSPRDPALLTEDVEPRRLPRSGFAKDSVEVEGYVRGLARRRPGIDVAVFRFANVVGPGVRTPLTSYFSLPLVPTPLGFDGRLQFVHEDDAVRVVRHAALGHVDGTYNVAGAGVLSLTQAVRRAGCVPVPVPLRGGALLGRVARRTGVADFSGEQLRYLCHGRALDCSRLRDDLGIVPAWSSREAFDDFVRARGPVAAAALRRVTHA